jgi:hypothetical protein
MFAGAGGKGAFSIQDTFFFELIRSFDQRAHSAMSADETYSSPEPSDDHLQEECRSSCEQPPGRADSLEHGNRGVESESEAETHIDEVCLLLA